MGEELSLNDVCSQIVDCEHKTAPEAAPGREYGYSIGTPNIRDGRLLLSTAKRVDKPTYDSWTVRETPHRNDIILTREAPVGEAAFLDGSELICLGQRTVLLRPDPAKISPRYLGYRLLGPELQERLRTRAEGSTVSHLNVADIRRTTLGVLPTLIEQDSIARLLGAIDDKIAVNQKLANTSSDLMRAIYERAIRQAATTTSIGKTADVFDGPHATPHKTDSGPWFLSISSLKDGRLVLSESAHLSEADFRRWTRRVVPLAGDVLFSYETRLGEAALMPPGVQACLGRRMALLRPQNGEVGPRTLLQAFLSKSFQSLIRQRAIHGATVDRIPLTSLPSWPIDLPTGNTRQLEDVLSSIDDVASSRERENERLADLRDTLLPKLISGEIRVRDAERNVEDAT